MSSANSSSDALVGGGFVAGFDQIFGSNHEHDSAEREPEVPGPRKKENGAPKRRPQNFRIPAHQCNRRR